MPEIEGKINIIQDAWKQEVICRFCICGTWHGSCHMVGAHEVLLVAWLNLDSEELSGCQDPPPTLSNQTTANRFPVRRPSEQFPWICQISLYLSLDCSALLASSLAFAATSGSAEEERAVAQHWLNRHQSSPGLACHQTYLVSWVCIAVCRDFLLVGSLFYSLISWPYSPQV